MDALINSQKASRRYKAAPSHVDEPRAPSASEPARTPADTRPGARSRSARECACAASSRLSPTARGARRSAGSPSPHGNPEASIGKTLTRRCEEVVEGRERRKKVGVSQNAHWSSRGGDETALSNGRPKKTTFYRFLPPSTLRYLSTSTSFLTVAQAAHLRHPRK